MLLDSHRPLGYSHLLQSPSRACPRSFPLRVSLVSHKPPRSSFRICTTRNITQVHTWKHPAPVPEVWVRIRCKMAAQHRSDCWGSRGGPASLRLYWPSSLFHPAPSPCTPCFSVCFFIDIITHTFSCHILNTLHYKYDFMLITWFGLSLNFCLMFFFFYSENSKFSSGSEKFQSCRTYLMGT